MRRAGLEDRIVTEGPSRMCEGPSIEKHTREMGISGLYTSFSERIIITYLVVNTIGNVTRVAEHSRARYTYGGITADMSTGGAFPLKQLLRPVEKG